MPATTHQTTGVRWRLAWARPTFRYSLILSIMALALIMLVFRYFLEFIELRPGVILHDPLLRLYEPVDVTWITFLLIYASLIGAIVILTRHPERLLVALQAYALMVLIRFGTIYLLPLEPPAHIILLKDPFVELFGSGTVLTKDLFFSGHTASLIILALTAPNPLTRWIFAIASLLVACCVLIQHVHYSVDVLVAPLVAYISYYAACRLAPRLS